MARAAKRQGMEETRSATKKKVRQRDRSVKWTSKETVNAFKGVKKAKKNTRRIK